MSGHQPHSASQEAVERMPQVGETIAGRYRLVNQIASGGMGVIMRAEQLSMQRDVAVKLLHPHMAEDPDTVRRFQREVELAKQLSHPNVIQVFDVGRTEHDVLFLVMEFLDGEELKDTLRRDAPLPVGRAVDIISQTLDGLAEAHDHGVIHRDLKPSNIFLLHKRRGDHVKLLDFGIAKSLESDHTALTKTGQLCGTANYMPPETFLQSSPGPAGDVYAAGLILLEMLTGRRTVAGDSMPETVMLHLKQPIELPPPIADSPLADIITGATAKHPDDRFPNADAMLDALERVEHDIRPNFQLSTRDIPGQQDPTSLGNFEADANLSVLRDAPSHEVGGQDSSPPETPAPDSPSTGLRTNELHKRHDDLDEQATEFLEELADRSGNNPAASARTRADSSPTSPANDTSHDDSSPASPPILDRVRRAVSLPTILVVASLIAATTGAAAFYFADDSPARSTSASATSAASNSVEIQVHTRPSDATVLHDGHKIGQTPIDKSVTQRQSAQTWTIKKEGFETRRVDITPDTNRTFNFQLRRADASDGRAHDDPNVQVFKPGDMTNAPDAGATGSSDSREPTHAQPEPAGSTSDAPPEDAPDDSTRSASSASDDNSNTDPSTSQPSPSSTPDDSPAADKSQTTDSEPPDESDDSIDKLFEQHRLESNE